MEIFNLPNRPNFTPPNLVNSEIIDSTGANLPTAGALTTPTTTSSRQIQFALKLTW
jgi:hypothetical protein